MHVPRRPAAASVAPAPARCLLSSVAVAVCSMTPPNMASSSASSSCHGMLITLVAACTQCDRPTSAGPPFTLRLVASVARPCLARPRGPARCRLESVASLFPSSSCVVSSRLISSHQPQPCSYNGCCCSSACSLLLRPGQITARARRSRVAPASLQSQS